MKTKSFASLLLTLMTLACAKQEYRPCLEQSVDEWGIANQLNSEIACAECREQGFSDYGLIIGMAPIEESEAAFFDRVSRAVIPNWDSYNSLQKMIFANYCTGNLDTTYEIYEGGRSRSTNFISGAIPIYVKRFRRPTEVLDQNGDTTVVWRYPYEGKGW